MINQIRRIQILLCSVLFLLPSLVLAQPKPFRELNIGYPFGGSTSFFWVAHRSGSFEKHGMRVKPIFIRGGVRACRRCFPGTC